MGFSRQEYWSGLLCLLPGDLPHPGIKLMSLPSPSLAGSLPLVPLGKPFMCVHGYSVLSYSLRLMDYSLLCPWDFPGKNTGGGCHFLLQGIFLTQGSNPHLLHLLLWQELLYHWATWEAIATSYLRNIINNLIFSLCPLKKFINKTFPASSIKP